MLGRPPISTLFPYTTLFRSQGRRCDLGRPASRRQRSYPRRFPRATESDWGICQAEEIDHSEDVKSCSDTNCEALCRKSATLGCQAFFALEISQRPVSDQCDLLVRHNLLHLLVACEGLELLGTGWPGACDRFQFITGQSGMNV